MRRKAVFVGTTFALLVLGAVAACLSPTEVTVVISTDLPCSELRGVTLSVGHLGSDLENRAPSVVSTDCDATGRLGSVVIVPSGDRSEEIAVRVVAGNGRDVESCVGPAYGAHCIVARRSLRYIPHTALTVPIVMRVSCDGVVCGPADTCVFGICRSAEIPRPEDCAGAGCGEQVLVPDRMLPDVDGGAGALPDGSSADSGTDVTVSPSFDAAGGGGPCDQVGGFQPNAPWPTIGGCPSHAGRTTATGPPANARIKWMVHANAGGSGSSFTGPSVAIAANGTIYAGGDALRAISPDGAVLWTAAGSVPNTPAIGRDDVVYASSGSTVSAFTASDGGVIWSRPTYSSTGPNLGIDGTIYIAGSSSNVGAYAPDGSALWSVTGPSSVPPVEATPAVGQDGTIYGAAVTPGTLTAYAPADGGVIWRASGSAPALTPPVVAPNGTAYSALGYYVIATRPDGAVAWTQAYTPMGNGSSQFPCSPAIGVDGTVYVAGGVDGFIHALDPATGSDKWTLALAGSLGCPLVDGQGTIYVGSSNGTLYSVAANHTVQLQLPIGSNVGAPLAMDAIGVLYVIAGDGNLYAIGK